MNDLSRSPRRKPWKTKVALLQWLKAHEESPNYIKSDTPLSKGKSERSDTSTDSANSSVHSKSNESGGSGKFAEKSDRSGRMSGSDTSLSSGSVSTTKSRSKKSFNIENNTKPTKGSQSKRAVYNKDGHVKNSIK